MMNNVIIASLAALAITYARELDVVNRDKDNIYIESSADNSTIGYGFSLYQNVLSVKINGTTDETDDSDDPAEFIVQPNLMIEYNSTIAYNSENATIYGFLNKANANENWGNGLSLNQFQSNPIDKDGKEIDGDQVSVWVAEGTYKEEGSPDFTAEMYISNAPTIFEGKTLDPRYITMTFEIKNYPSVLEDSRLALDQTVISRAGKNIAPVEIGTPLLGSLGQVSINSECKTDDQESDTSLIDGGEAESIVYGNSTFYNLEGASGNTWVVSADTDNSFSNFLMEQRLWISIAELERQQSGTSDSSDDDDNDDNAASANGVKYGLLAASTMMLVAIFI